jgi:Mg2+ and Co2+ transporter CorA
MDVRFVDASGAQQYDGPEASSLLMREDGFVWVDVPGWDDEAEKLLLRDLGCHPLVIESCRQRNHVPASHSYPQHYFVTMHAPLLGDAGHVHLLELDLIIGAHYLVTVHGPLNPAVDSREALVETSAVLRRIGSGRFRPTSPARWPMRWAPRSRAGNGR